MTFATPEGIITINLYNGSLEQFHKVANPDREVMFDEIDVLCSTLTDTTQSLFDGLIGTLGVDNIEHISNIVEVVMDTIFILKLSSD